MPLIDVVHVYVCSVLKFKFCILFVFTCIRSYPTNVIDVPLCHRYILYCVFMANKDTIGYYEWPIVSEETCFCNAVPHKQCSSSYMICLTTCLSGHLEWWECLNMYKMHLISHMEPKVQLFSDTLSQKMHDLTMKPLFICKDLPLSLCVRKLRIHNSLNYQNRQNTFWDIWKYARGGNYCFGWVYTVLLRF